jgi:flagellin
MALAIATNNAALNAAASASSVNRDMETSMARLSSGKRINSASDDAAGVAISSRLSAEIRGTDQAIRNSLDGQALIDTAEGAHSEIENILQRMREVSVQAANDTNNSQDRANLQAEMNALVTEIDRIAGTTTWAGENLMRDEAGSFFSFQVGTATGEKNQIDITINGMGSNMLGFSTEPRDPDTPDLSDVSVSESGYVAAVPATFNDDAVAYQAEVPYQAATEITPFIPEVPYQAEVQAQAATEATPFIPEVPYQAEVPATVLTSASPAAHQYQADVHQGAEITAAGLVRLNNGLQEATIIIPNKADPTTDTADVPITISLASDVNTAMEDINAALITQGWPTAEIQAVVGATGGSDADSDLGQLKLMGTAVATAGITFGIDEINSTPNVTLSQADLGVRLDFADPSVPATLNFNLAGGPGNYDLPLIDPADIEGSIAAINADSGTHGLHAYTRSEGDPADGIIHLREATVDAGGLGDITASPSDPVDVTFVDGTYRSDRTGNTRSTDHADGPFVAKGAYVAEVLDTDGSPEVQYQAAVPATFNNDAVEYQAEVLYQAAVPATFNDDEVPYQAEVQAQAATEATPFIPEVPATADGTFSGSTGSFTLTAGKTDVTLTLGSTSVEIDTAPVPAIPGAPLDVSDSNGNKAAVQIIADKINSGTDVHLFTAVANEDGTVTIKAPVVPGATSVLDARDARETIVVIDDAIQTVNIQRSTLGAVSNRLSHTINNLTNISSNLSAAQGGIEDADFAHETTMLAKNQILQQASTAMLAHANASKQNVLSLLQG